jgi:hypothetical protein
MLLTALCCEHDPRLAKREEMLALLKEMVKQGRSPLVRALGEANFPSLSPGQRYEILSCQPAESLTPADHDCLAQCAAGAGRLRDALSHAQAALQHGGDPQFERRRVIVELLFRLERADEAVNTAQRWAVTANAAPEPLAAMAELLVKFGRHSPADALFARAVAAKELTPQQRFDLLCRRAAICDGKRRWQFLLEAAETVPANSAGRNQCLDRIVAELVEPSQAEIAAELAAQTREPDLKAELLLVQAKLTESYKDQAEIYWQVHKLGRLDGECLNLAFMVWNVAEQPQRVIEVAEQYLRGRKLLSPQTELHELGIAYGAVGRNADERRTMQTDPEPPDGPKSSTGSQFNRGRQGMGGGMF